MSEDTKRSWWDHLGRTDALASWLERLARWWNHLSSVQQIATLVPTLVALIFGANEAYLHLFPDQPEEPPPPPPARWGAVFQESFDKENIPVEHVEHHWGLPEGEASTLELGNADGGGYVVGQRSEEGYYVVVRRWGDDNAQTAFLGTQNELADAVDAFVAGTIDLDEVRKREPNSSNFQTLIDDPERFEFKRCYGPGEPCD